MSSVEPKEAIENAKRGMRHPEKMRTARERMDAAREEIRRRLGELNVAVELVRESRDR